MELHVFKMHTHFFYKFKMLLNFNAAPNVYSWNQCCIFQYV